MPSSLTLPLSYDPDQLYQAIDALQHYYRETHAKGKKGEEKNLQLMINFHHFPRQKPSLPRFLSLPFTSQSTQAESDLTSICLIVKDPAKVEALMDASMKTMYPNLHLLPLRQLKLDFPLYKQKRKLAHRYDMFLCESRVYQDMPKLLGKFFYQSKKMPIKVRLDNLSVTLIQKCLRTITYRIPSGHCLTLPMGSLSDLTREQLFQNIQWSLEKILRKVMKKSTPTTSHSPPWINIKSLGLGFHRVPMLPFYLSMTPPPAETIVFEASTDDESKTFEIPSDYEISSDSDHHDE